jgi:ATP:ADP antiporter, AAA family
LLLRVVLYYTATWELLEEEGMPHRLMQLLNIHSGEGPLVGLVLGYGFALGLGRAFCATAVSGLFLSIFGAQAMPYVFIGTALVVPITGVGYLQLQARMSLPRLLAGTIVALALGVLGLRLLLGLNDAPWLVMGGMIGYTILYVLITLAFWGLSGLIFNVRQARRLFGLLGSGSEMADVVGGVLTLLLAPFIGALNLLLLAAAALLAALGLQRLITRRAAEQLAATEEEAKSEASPAISTIFKSRYVRLLVGLIALSQVGYFFVENIFYDLSMAHFSGPDAFSSLVGGTIAATSVLTLLLQVTAAGWLANRYGPRVTQVILPTAVLAGALTVAISGTLFGAAFVVFVLMLVTRIGERALRFSVEESSIQVAYQPLPAAQRSFVQTLVAGGIRPLTAGVAGGLILLFTQGFGFDGVALSYLLVLITMAWVVLAYATGRAYSGALSEALSQRRLSGVGLNLADSASLALVQQSLHSPHAGEALYALQLLAELEHPDLPQALGTLLEHQEPLVRRDALQRIAALRLTMLASAVAQRISVETDPLTRGQVLRTYAVLDPAAAHAYLRAALASEEGEAQVAAAVTLAQIGEAGLVQNWLHERVESTHTIERVLAARALCELPGSGTLPLLQRLLADEAVVVRNAAFGALAHSEEHDRWPLAVAALNDPPSHDAAAAALVAGGTATLPALRRAYEESGREQRLLILQVCGRIGGAASELVSKAIADPDEQIRQQALAALEQAGYQASGALAELAQRQLGVEVRLSTWLLAAQRDLGPATVYAPLQAALGRARERCRERVLGLLGLLYDRATIEKARANLSHRSSEQRAYAVEAIDLLLPRPLKPLVLPLLEGTTPQAMLAQLEKQFPQPARSAQEWLIALAEQPGLHPWLGTCARYAADRSDHEERETVKRVALLQNTLLFAAVPVEALVPVAQSLQSVSCPGNTTIFAAGDPGDSLYMIEHGQVDIHTGSRILSSLGPGAVFGEAAAFDKAPRAASATTANQSDLLRLDHDILYSLIGSHTAVAHGIIKALIRYVRQNTRNHGSTESHGSHGTEGTEAESRHAMR